jgi:putative FmdB family regulatory protein
MPFYEYECTKCSNQTEVFQKITDPPVTKCELCNGKMRKLISQSSFHLKGSGWYVTDYASKTGGYDGKTGTGEADSTVKEQATKETKDSTETSVKKDTSTTESKKKKDKD